MKYTKIKLNPMPKRGVKPPSLPDEALVILTTPSENRVMNIIDTAAETNWQSRETHYIVLNAV